MVGVAMLVITVGVASLSVKNMMELVSKAEADDLHTKFVSFTNSIENEARMAHALSVMVSSLPQFQSAFSRGDRNAMLSMLQVGFENLKEQFGVKQFQIHTPPAVSFLRVHKPEKYGDDLSGFRSTVVQTNLSGEGVQGLELGLAGLGIRAVVPVYHGETHLGSVEFGMSLGKEFFEKFKDAHGTEVSMHLVKEDGFKPFASTLDDVFLVSESELEQVLAEEFKPRPTKLGSTPYMIYAETIYDYSGNAIGVVGMASDRSHYINWINESVMMILGAAAVLIVVGIALTYFISRSITNPIVKSVKVVERIAEGDLSCSVEANSKDEVGKLLSAVDAMVKKFRERLISITETATILDENANQLSRISNDSLKGMRYQQEQIDCLSSAITQMSASVDEVSRNTSKAAQTSEQTLSQSSEGQESMGMTLSSITDVESEIGSISRIVDDVATSSTEIGAVIKVIDDIAEQTNLLALNAAIEAARAGEQGRGFAVVADEVRILAQRTQSSTKEIRNTIEGLQLHANNAVKAFSKSKEDVAKTVEEARMAIERFQTISGSIGFITDMSAQIAASTEEQSSVATQINGHVISIAETSRKTTESSTIVNHTAEELAEMSKALKSGVAEFNF